MNRFYVCFLLIVVFSLSSCANWNKDEEVDSPYQGMTAKQLYLSAKKSIDARQYASAAKQLEALESLYPFNEDAEKAQLNLIYVYYKNEDYASAAAAAERFIHVYPRANHVDYAYYMKGLANFQQSRGVFARWLPIDESIRSPGTQAVAYSDFGTLVQRFPKSYYKANALQRMIYLRNMFAERELKAAVYYYDRKLYVASAGRAEYLIKNYPQAPSAQKALIILRNANRALGLNTAAEEAAKVYNTTYKS